MTEAQPAPADPAIHAIVWRDAPLALATVDHLGRFIDTNPAMEQLLGSLPGELEGRPIRDYMHPGDTVAAMRAFDRLVDGGIPGDEFETTVSLRTKQGRTLVRLLVMVAQFDRSENNPKFVRCIAMVRRADPDRAEYDADGPTAVQGTTSIMGILRDPENRKAIAFVLIIAALAFSGRLVDLLELWIGSTGGG